jgi:hypothetical protein
MELYDAAPTRDRGKFEDMNKAGFRVRSSRIATSNVKSNGDGGNGDDAETTPLSTTVRSAANNLI